MALAIALLLAGCDEAVPLAYRTHAEAAAEGSFARGWLPEIIPASSVAISMKNDLDLNTSSGNFSFSPADHDRFVSLLTRVTDQDRKGETAYAYQNWIFWINGTKDHCRFRLGSRG